MYTYEYPRPMVTVDVVAITKQDSQNFVLLIQRKHEPFQGYWALPGGFVALDESLEAAAARELAEETGLEGISLEQLHTYGDPQRDPRGRVISVVYLAIIPAGLSLNLQAGSDASQARWFPIAELPELAFDHQKIIDQAFSRI
jgi:8-oxo-dGTP diphosphatase